MKLHFSNDNIKELYAPSYIDNFFNDEDIYKLNDLVENIEIQRARIGQESHNNENNNIRKSNVKWIDPNQTPDWLKQKIIEGFIYINQEHYGFYLTGSEPFQYTIYNSDERGEYKWHCDTGIFDQEVRKLSMSMLISDRNEFVGGNLILSPHGNPIVAEEKKGRATFFPSWVPHCVTPVTKGVRKSLVIWAHGPAFK